MIRLALRRGFLLLVLFLLGLVRLLAGLLLLALFLVLFPASVSHDRLLYFDVRREVCPLKVIAFEFGASDLFRI
jgi:hypothetical protein